MPLNGCGKDSPLHLAVVDTFDILHLILRYWCANFDILVFVHSNFNSHCVFFEQLNRYILTTNCYNSTYYGMEYIIVCGIVCS